MKYPSTHVLSSGVVFFFLCLSEMVCLPSSHIDSEVLIRVARMSYMTRKKICNKMAYAPCR